MAIRLRKRFKASAKKDLSRIHWNLRRKGLGFSAAYRAARAAKGMAWKFKRKHAYKDYDKDGVVNKYDCQPRNRWKQDGEGLKYGIEVGKKTSSKEWKERNKPIDYGDEGFSVPDADYEKGLRIGRRIRRGTR